MVFVIATTVGLAPPSTAASTGPSAAAVLPAASVTAAAAVDDSTMEMTVVPMSYLDGAESMAAAKQRYAEVKNHPKLADPQLESLRRAQAAGNKSFYDTSTIDESSTQRSAISPPSEPDGGFADECRARGSWIKNRFEWCTTWIATALKFRDGLPVGYMFMTIELIGYGRDDGVRSIVIYGRPTAVFFGQEITAFDSVGLDLDCGIEGDPGCADSAAISKPLSAWVADSTLGAWSRWEITSNESVAPEQFNRLLGHDFHFSVRLGAASDLTEDFGIRCDSAPYFPTGRPKACIFADVIPHLQYSIKDENGNDTNQKEAALHIRQAQDFPNTTDPAELWDKEIPGKYTGVPWEGYLNRVPGETSVFPPPTEWLANERQRLIGCATLPAPPADMVRPQCDEYPFKTTLQGAASEVWDYSVKKITGSHNESAGSLLGHYYEDDRILYREVDRFYVEIRDQAGPPSPPGPILRVLPTVNGQEGVPIQLMAQTTLSGASARWRYQPFGPVDEGTQCFFSDANTFNPTLTCNDDGVFIASVEVDDGVNPVLFGETVVNVFNAPPRVHIQEPTEWQLFRVGAPIVFDVPFSDASNDTHICTYEWDDNERHDVFQPVGFHNCGTVGGFEHAGMYTVKVSVTDDDDGTGTDEVMIVVFDPNEGSAGIAGDTATPRGALVSDPTAAGETNVYFNAQYPLGGGLPVHLDPEGQTLAWVDGTTFRLELDAMQWLVITQDGKVAARGTGRVSNQPGYTWVLYGYDYCNGSTNPGCQNTTIDRLRMVIWETATNRKVYDHSPGSSEYDVDRIEPTPMTAGGVRVRRFPR